MTGPVLRAASAEVAVGRAAALAHRGELDEARRILCELDAAGDTHPVALDLLARVHAQRGEYAQADACWARVLESDPADAGAVAGRRALAEIRDGRRPARARRRTGGIAAVLLTVAVAAGVGLGFGDTGPGAAPVEGDVRAAQEPGDDPPASRAETEPVPAPTDPGERLDEIVAALAMPGVDVARADGGVGVRFADAVFVRSDTVSSDAAAVLRELGARLAGLDVTTTVVGHAVVVPGGPDRGGSTVALARAQRAAVLLAEGGGALTDFTLRTADQRTGPFPDDDRNRTVTLQLVPR